MPQPAVRRQPAARQQAAAPAWRAAPAPWPEAVTLDRQAAEARAAALEDGSTHRFQENS
jgi:hypothetical protein